MSQCPSPSGSTRTLSDCWLRYDLESTPDKNDWRYTYSMDTLTPVSLVFAKRNSTLQIVSVLADFYLNTCYVDTCYWRTCR